MSQDNWEEEIEQIPLFMTKAPTAEQVASNPQLQMIQQIIEEESTPESRAIYSKDHGNEIFMKAKKAKTNVRVRNQEFHKAMKLYDEGLEEMCDNAKLNAILHCNRAAINLLLGNSRKVITDCAEAIKLDKSNVKAYFRAASACSKLENYSEAIEWADKGLSIDPANKTLVDARTKANKAKGAIDKAARKKAQMKKKAEKAAKELSTAIAARGIQLKEGIETEMKQHDARKGVVDTVSGGEVFLDSDGMLHWPMAFLYPEHKQTDFIKDFNEGTMFQDHLEMMFAERVPWDSDGKYRPGSLSLYYETQKDAKKRTTVVEVDPGSVLLDVMIDKRYCVEDMTPAIFILSKGSPFEKQFFERTQRRSLGASVSKRAYLFPSSSFLPCFIRCMFNARFYYYYTVVVSYSFPFFFFFLFSFPLL